MKDEDFMRLAIKKAHEGIKKGQTPFGACIVKNDKVISCEHNVVWKTTDITMHAEMHAIRVACKKLKTVDLSGCTIYSTCEPCPMCFSAIHWAGISKIVFGTSISDAKKCSFSELTISNEKMKKNGKSKVKIKGNFLRKESMELFNRFNSKKDKKVY
jgi:tRNA(Arg) A34 adenosine deaminase TadA